MRISDWSSDVCSSDLDRFWRLSNHDESIPVIARCGVKTGAESIYGEAAPSFQCQDIANDSYKKSHLIRPDTQEVRIDVYDLDSDAAPAPVPTRSQDRSEEHTSELQSLMRLSYAVFCLKKKNTY